MPSYSYPGIYIQELPGKPGPVVGSSPSTAAFIGWTLEGPADEPTLVTSFPEFTEKFGTFTADSNLPTSVFAFFQNGGGMARIVRVGASDSVKASTFLEFAEASEAQVPNSGAPVAGQKVFVFSGANTLDSLPVKAGSFEMTDSGAPGDKWTDDGAGALVREGATGTGTLDYDTGEITLSFDTAPGATVTFDFAYDFRTFDLTMEWPGEVGNDFRVVLSGDSNFESLADAKFSRFVVEVQRVTDLVWATVETFSGVVLDDATSNDFISTVLNDERKGSKFVAVKSYGNEIVPADLSGSAKTAEAGVLAPAPDDSKKQFSDELASSCNPFTYTGEVAISESGVQVGLGDALVSPACALPATAATAAIPAPGGGNLESAATVVVRWTDTVPTARKAWIKTAGAVASVYKLTDGTNDQGTIDISTGAIAMTFNAAPDYAAAGTPITADVQWGNKIELEDDGVGNIAITSASAGPSHITLNSSGTNTIDYGDETASEKATVSFMLKASDDPTRGPSPAVLLSAIPLTSMTSTYKSQPAADSVMVAFASGDNGSALSRSVVSAPALAADEKGLYSLNKSDELLSVVIPDFETDSIVSGDLIDYCANRKDRFAIVSVPEGLSYSEAANYKKVTLNKNTSYAALYYPHIQIIDPVTEKARLLPPGGHIAGVFARTDEAKNVSKAPAGTSDGVLRFSTGLEFSLTPVQVGVVNLAHVNALVQWTYTGRAVWGARTLQAAGEFPYIQMRRLFMYLEKSVFNNTWGFVFESNGEQLQSQVKMKIESFLLSLYTTGHFSGGSPAESFYVTCDSSNNSAENVAKGLLTCDIGVAPTRPAEFITFRFQQKALEG